MVKLNNIELGDFPLWLSPMEDITDPPFRKICKEFGADVLVSEFVSSEALIRNAQKSLRKLDFDEVERPLAIQIFGHNEESMRIAAEVAAEQNPDFIDINWGCPVKKVVAKGAGAGILQNIPQMIAITKAVVESVRIPVTIKTRLGWDDGSKPIVSIAESLQDVGIAGISIHGRTRSQMYKGEADWTLIGDVKNNPRMNIPVFGNGDITSATKALEYKNKYGVDGMLIGRGAIGNPWIFSEIKALFSDPSSLPVEIRVEKRIEICKKHLKASIEWKGEKVAVQEMKKHYSPYFKGIPHFKPYKMQLLLSSKGEEVEEILETLLGLHKSMDYTEK